MKVDILYSVDDLPVQQNRVYSTPEEAKACSRGKLVLVQDPLTGIVHNDSFEPDLVVYDDNYQNEQAHSEIFQSHLDRVTELITRYARNKSILEIGCGKGTFLQRLRDRGFNVFGVDPAYDGKSKYIIKNIFSASLGLTADIIILRHVLEHISEPLNFLAKVRDANGGKGIVYIESPCLDWISENRTWFDVYYEHVNYFRISDVSRMFTNVFESGRLFDGQYLYAVADLSSLETTIPGRVSDFRFPDDFFDGVDRAIATIRENKRRKNVLWGASSKGVLFAFHILQKAGVRLEAAIDINPAKQNRYLPATALQVVSPADGLSRLKPGDAIFVMNSNYFEEIKSSAGNQFTYIRVDKHEF